tara:strand:- start:37 stop:234 length:198 start_codon:yes stop_codon:yes gene_type:complete
MKYYKKTQATLVRIRRRRGLGDVVHAVAQPIAKAIDKVAGTNIQRCGGCKRRRARLNGITQTPHT